MDITNTGVTRFSDEQEKERNQQRNWETVLQVLGMRTQLFRAEQLTSNKQNLKDYSFGSIYTGKHTVWTFEFETEFLNVIPLSDFNHVPIITGLDETVKFHMNLFYTDDVNKNIYFTLS